MLHRRNSTATDMKFPMYLVPLDQLERLYGGKEPRYDRIEAHQELLRRGELVRWIDLTNRRAYNLLFTRMGRLEPSRPTRSSAQDISQSHETTSLGRNFSSRDERLSHVDVQDQSRRESREMARYFEQSVRIDLSLSFARSLTLLLMSRYVWIDWSSMPQPSACPPNVDEEVKKELGTNLGKAVKSIPAYVLTSLSTFI